MKNTQSPARLEQIEEFIVNGVWTAGTSLPAERQLASQLGCSRSSLREHLIGLRSRGLIESRRGAGHIVAQPRPSPLESLIHQSPRSRQELLAVRTALDALAAEGAAALATKQELASIRQQHRLFAAAVDARDQAAMIRHDTELHLAIAAASHNRVLEEIARHLRDALEAGIAVSSDRLFDQMGFSQGVIEQHAKIVAAIAQRNGLEARAASEQHTADISKRLQQLDFGKKQPGKFG